MLTARLEPRFRFPDIKCAFCRTYPCECKPLARCTCACGGTLEAADDLESKRAAAELHSRSARHLAWRAGR